ncbi:hypothetical protein BCR33DRAFT_779236 [Rhizoclosmatium globosum]|uniref:Uncharacterized protein n=1 Tax=Rhizoclosmatium globosum TaxID=329046 RepID=A0A1Y2D0W4_9FUNG|nr:hypothetical protein BCR33DRAFT_779236 [Rhizoclosmatium globosum]|eukprot:ORY52847.1 hypothetical protein BCR33DRAFT_779236 [Rhizoclosmatium globosum]
MQSISTRALMITSVSLVPPSDGGFIVETSGSSNILVQGPTSNPRIPQLNQLLKNHKPRPNLRNLINLLQLLHPTTLHQLAHPNPVPQHDIQRLLSSAQAFKPIGGVSGCPFGDGFGVGGGGGLEACRAFFGYYVVSGDA